MGSNSAGVLIYLLKKINNGKFNEANNNYYLFGS